MNFAVIGGGIGGVLTSMEIADAGGNNSIDLYEINSSLLKGTTTKTPWRLGAGFHYCDEETALKYLHSSIAFLKAFPDCVISGKKAQSHAHRRGRYFIVRNSTFDLPRILKVYEAIKAEYTRLVEEDPSNAVFGDPNKLYRTLALDEYKDLVDTKEVILGIETAEQVLDWPKLQQRLQQTLEKKYKGRIRVHTSAEVLKVNHNEDRESSSRFTVNFINPELKPKLMAELKIEEKLRTIAPEERAADFIINSSWHNIEKISDASGFFPEPVTNRLKVIAKIKLPPDFEKKGPINSMFFCFGPHASFTNCGDGTAFVSYEPVTNVGTSTDLKLPAEFEKFLYEEADQATKEYYASRILEGVRKYIKLSGLEKPEIVDVLFGIVKCKGHVDINSAESIIHQRRESGIESQQIGFINNACMKLMYGVNNAKEIRNLVEEHIDIDKTIQNVILKIFSYMNLGNNKKIYINFLRSYLERYLDYSDFKSYKSLDYKKQPKEQPEEKMCYDIISKWSYTKLLPTLQSTITHKEKANNEFKTEYRTLISSLKKVETNIKSDIQVIVHEEKKDTATSPSSESTFIPAPKP